MRESAAPGSPSPRRKRTSTRSARRRARCDQRPGLPAGGRSVVVRDLLHCSAPPVASPPAGPSSRCAARSARPRETDNGRAARRRVQVLVRTSRRRSIDVVERGVGAAAYVGGGAGGLGGWPALLVHVPVLSRDDHALALRGTAAARRLRLDVTVEATSSQDYTAAVPALEFYYYRIALRGGRARPSRRRAAPPSSSSVPPRLLWRLGSTLCRFGTQAVRAAARLSRRVKCTAPNTCDPLTTTGTACRAAC